jgi:hypothetical protein
LGQNASLERHASDAVSGVGGGRSSPRTDISNGRIETGAMGSARIPPVGNGVMSDETQATVSVIDCGKNDASLTLP